MNGEFVHKDESGWEPEYNGIEWLGKWATALAKYEVEIPPPVYFRTEDGFVVQCVMENTRIYTNDTEPDMEVIAVFDPRDGLWFNFFRSKLGTESFDKLAEVLVMWATTIDTPIPLPEVQAHYFADMQSDIGQETLFIPDGWEEEQSGK